MFLIVENCCFVQNAIQFWKASDFYDPPVSAYSLAGFPFWLRLMSTLEESVTKRESHK